MQNKNLVKCKACGNDISRKAKKCPSCGHDQRNFFQKHKILTVILGLAILGGIGSALGGGEEPVEYIAYNYGDTLKKENTIPESDFKLPDGLSVEIVSQEIVTKDELKDANFLNSANNEVAVLLIKFTNSGKEAINYNTIGFTYATKNGVQVDSWASFNVLPDKFSAFDSFSAGDLMPGSNFTRIASVEIPDNDPVKRIYYRYFGSEFSVELPD